MSQPGSKAIRVGIVLVVVSAVVGLVGSILTVGRMDESSLTRDVVIDGAAMVEVPGRISFTVAEAMSDRAPRRMTVAVLVRRPDDWSARCEFTDESGGVVDSGAVLTGGGYVHPNDTKLEPVQVAKLEPGRYQVECEQQDGAESSSSRFTVGRVIGPSDLTSGELAPLLWFGLVLLVSGILFVAGLVVLTVGLTRRRRWRREGGGPFPPGWGGYGPPGPPGQHPRQGWGPPSQPQQPGPYGAPPPPGSYGAPPPPGSYGAPPTPPHPQPEDPRPGAGTPPGGPAPSEQPGTEPDDPFGTGLHPPG